MTKPTNQAHYFRNTGPPSLDPALHQRDRAAAAPLAEQGDSNPDVRAGDGHGGDRRGPTDARAPGCAAAGARYLCAADRYQLRCDWLGGGLRIAPTDRVCRTRRSGDGVGLYRRAGGARCPARIDRPRYPVDALGRDDVRRRQQVAHAAHVPQYEGLLLAILRPRAFMGLVVLIALKHRIDQLQRERAPAGIVVQPAQPASAS